MQANNNVIIGSTKRWATIKMMPKIYPEIIKESYIRWLIFNEHHNGFHQCVRRLGAKILIDLDAFEGWVDSPKGAVSNG